MNNRLCITNTRPRVTGRPQGCGKRAITRQLILLRLPLMLILYKPFSIAKMLLWRTPIFSHLFRGPRNLGDRN